MNLTKMQAIGKSPLTTIVYENIKQAIMEGHIQPGSRITEATISKQLDVSSTPVREAFRRLESERFVKILPYRGAVVQEFSTKEVEEVFQCRKSLEALAIELAVDKIDEEGIKQLRTLVEQSKAEENFSEYVNINRSIHETILSYANNATLENLLEQLQDVMYHDRNKSTMNMERKKEAYDEHLEIIDALEIREKEAAVRAMQAHIANEHAYIIETGP